MKKTKQKRLTEKWRSIIGCTAFFEEKEGDVWMVIMKNCTAYKMVKPMGEKLPPHMVVGYKGRMLLISWDGFQIHQFPKNRSIIK